MVQGYRLSHRPVVVGAVFKDQNRYLVFRRKPGLRNAGEWEFPGGKKEPDETDAVALKREIAEELGVTIEVGATLGKHETNTIELRCYLVSGWQGEFELTDHDKTEWCDTARLKMIGLSEADLPFIDRLAEI